MEASLHERSGMWQVLRQFVFIQYVLTRLSRFVTQTNPHLTRPFASSLHLNDSTNEWHLEYFVPLFEVFAFAVQVLATLYVSYSAPVQSCVYLGVGLLDLMVQGTGQWRTREKAVFFVDCLSE